MRIRLWGALLFVATLFLTGCATESPKYPEAAMILHEENSGRNYQLKVSDVMEISLPENPTTGYTWSCKIKEQNGKTLPSPLSLLGETYTPHQQEADIAGSGGVKTYFLQADHPGKVEVICKLLRPWEKDWFVKELHFWIVITEK